MASSSSPQHQPSTPSHPAPRPPTDPRKHGFLRIKLLNIELVTDAPINADEIREPYCAVNIKEAEGELLVQRKRTIYPPWNSSFDSHVYSGRVAQFVIMEKQNRQMADVQIEVEQLADKCFEAGGSGPISLTTTPKGR